MTIPTTMAIAVSKPYLFSKPLFILLFPLLFLSHLHAYPHQRSYALHYKSTIFSQKKQPILRKLILLFLQEHKKTPFFVRKRVFRCVPIGSLAFIPA